MLASPVYKEVIDFIAAGTTPSKLIDFEPSQTTKERVEDLIYREKTNKLTPEEIAELNNFFQLEHLIRLAKARARHYLNLTNE